MATQEILVAEGFRVTVSATSSKAVEMVRDGLRPDLVLLDFRMPELSGPEVLAQMRVQGLRCPAVLVSAILDVGKTAQGSGFSAYLEKPFSVGDLVALIRPLVGTQSLS